MAGALLMKKFPSFSTTMCIVDEIESFNCPICLEIYEKPRRISCGHVFCKGCLSNYDDILEPACPVCRQLFIVSSAKKASDVEKSINSSAWICKICSLKVPLSKLRLHNSMCPPGVEKINGAGAGAVGNSCTPKHSSKDMFSTGTNRHTFRCPYCGLQNFDTHGLVKHCNENHYGHSGAVVCPICVSMPWGNPRQKSVNFLAHLNLRHQFEYEFIVDYQLDDEAALKKALKASLEEQ